MKSTGQSHPEVALRALRVLARAEDRASLDVAIDATLADLVALTSAVGAFVAWSTGGGSNFDILRQVPVPASPEADPLRRVTGSAEGSPEEASGLLEVIHTQPFAIEPLRCRGVLRGYVGCTFAREALIDRELLELLAVLADGITAAFACHEAVARSHENEDRLQSLIQGTTDAVWCYESRDGISLESPLERQLDAIREMVLVEANLAYARVRGVSGPEMMLGRKMREVAVTAEEGIRRAYRLLHANDFARVVIEVESPSRDGIRHLVIECFAVVRDRKLHRLWGSIRDVTEHRRDEARKAALEKQLQHAQKLESVGLLAGGIAHDFNNLLTVIGTSARAAGKRMDAQPDRARAALELVVQASDRAAELTRRLLAFARHEPSRNEVFDLRALVRDAMRMICRLVPESVELVFHDEPEPLLVDADPSQLEQVLVNLCLNAADSLERAGKVQVRVEPFVVTPELARRNPGARPGPNVRLSVTDHGTGMPAEVRERIFEPFFTTKPMGRGTGLGLSIVYGIAQRHGGFVDVESEVGVGSTFHLVLPAAERPLVAVDATVEAASSIGGNETILVVEDDELVRRVAVQILEGAGYQLVVAADGPEAVRLFEAEPGRFDLVLLDAVLPGMHGREVYERVVAARPDIRVLFASGYTNGALPDDFLSEHGLVLLAKPYTEAAMLRAVRAVLDAPTRTLHA